MIVMAVREDDVVLPPAARVQRLIVVGFDRAVLQVAAESGVSI